ncbi:MAG TPA: precorrin-3B synthase [Hyphomicrobium sp.]|jgi:precorrin-3B synthase
MTSLALKSARGWCPGAWRPMESGDGLIVRVRPRVGALRPSELETIAGMAERHGNGLVDLTRRANIQLRGVKTESLGALWQELAQIGLLDESAKAESVRNVMLSPLAGIDPHEILDVRPLAREIEERLANDEALRLLPAKFGFVVDGGGLLSLDDERADVRLKAVGESGTAMVAIGVDRPDGPAWLGLAEPAVAAGMAIEVAHAYLAVAPDAHCQMRDLSDAAWRQLCGSVTSSLAPMTALVEKRAQRAMVARIADGGAVVAAGFAAPFGRLDAATLQRLAIGAASLGVDEFRLSPWRALYVGVTCEKTASAIIEIAARASLIVDVDDPLLLVDACPGSPSCRSTALDTRAAARQLVPILRQLGCRTAHVSGCAKGCARSKPADLVLVGVGDCFGVLRYDTARGSPRTFVPPASLSELPELLKNS